MSSSQQAFTLLEVILSLAILASLMSGVAMLLKIPAKSKLACPKQAMLTTACRWQWKNFLVI